MKVIKVIMAALAVFMLVIALSDSATAKCIQDNNGRTICAGSSGPTIARVVRAHRVDANGSGVQIIGGRPAGCPWKYCGCGLRKYLGLDDVRLNLAANWGRMFPRERSPRPGLAAVRPGHVMYIEAAAGGGQWLIRDYNSGGGLSRLHVRDVRGYVFVNPHRSVALLR